MRPVPTRISGTPEADSGSCLPSGPTDGETILDGLLNSAGGTVSAAGLLKHFPSIGHVLSAETVQLSSFGLNAAQIALLRLVRETACHLSRANIRNRPLLGNWQALIDYLRTAMSHEQVEQFRVLYLDRRNCLIADEAQMGTVSFIPVCPREVVKRALILNASALIVAHNHPSGDPKPSRDDIETTRQLKAAAQTLEIELHDHVVIGHGKHSSFRSLGLL